MTVQAVRRLVRRPATLVILAAVAFLLADLVLVLVVAPADFAFDFTCCYQQAASRVLEDPGTLYEWSDTYTFRYTPLGALLFVPLAPLTETAAAWVWLAAKLAVLVATALWFARPWSTDRRWLVALAVMAFPPIVHDLVIGNVSTITLLVLLAVGRWQDPRGGIALGLLVLLMPKPHLIPVAAYLAFRRPRDFGAAVATILGGLLVGLAIFGLDPWLAFVGTLREPLGRTFTANVGFSGLLGPPGVVVGIGVALFIFAAGVMVGGSRGYGLSILAGIIAGPYTFIHYLAGTLVAAEPVLRARPRWLAPFPWLLVVFPLIPIWMVALAGAVRAAPPPAGEAAPPGAARG